MFKLECVLVYSVQYANAYRAHVQSTMSHAPSPMEAHESIDTWKRLRAYLCSHKAVYPRRARERLEWLGDAVLRDLVVHHLLFSESESHLQSKNEDDFEKRMKLCDLCCSNASLSKVWDFAMSSEQTGFPMKSKHASALKSHSSKWKADMIESALGGLIVDASKHHAKSLSLIDVLISSVFDTAAWLVGSPSVSRSGSKDFQRHLSDRPDLVFDNTGGSLDEEATRVSIHSTLLQCEFGELGWKAKQGGARNTNLFDCLSPGSDSEPELEPKPEPEPELELEPESESESNTSHLVLEGSVVSEPEKSKPAKSNITKHRLDAYGAASLRASISLVIYNCLEKNATPRHLTRERQRLMASREILWSRALKCMQERARFWLDTKSDKRGTYEWAAEIAKDEWRIKAVMRTPHTKDSSNAAASSLHESFPGSVPKRACAGELNFTSLTDLCVLMFNLARPQVEAHISPDGALPNHAHSWRVEIGYTLSREAALHALRSSGILSAPKSLKRKTLLASETLASEIDSVSSNQAKRRRLMSPPGKNIVPSSGGKHESRSIRVSARDMALLSRFSGHKELQDAVELAIHCDADPGVSNSKGEDMTKCCIILDDPLERKLAHALIAAHGVKSAGVTVKGGKRGVRILHSRESWRRLHWPNRVAPPVSSGTCMCTMQGSHIKF